jgi:hypothetical protein
MSISGQSGVGKIRLFNDFCGPEIPVTNAVAYGTTAGGCHYSLGDFTVRGHLSETDTGVVDLEKSSGWVRFGYNDQDTYGVWIGSGLEFSPTLNGPMIVEARIEHRALTTKNVFVGFIGTLADDALEIITNTTTTCTRIGNAVGFMFDSQITINTVAATCCYHMPYMISTTTSQTATDIASSQIIVAAEADILRVEIDPDGAARWYMNGKLEQSVGAGLAADVDTLLAGGVGCWGTTTTDSDVDMDYLLVEANRDWTR